MAELFDKNSDTTGLHLRNIHKSGELEKPATTEESSVVRQEGKRQARRKINLYNLDAIISVGYNESNLPKPTNQMNRMTAVTTFPTIHLDRTI